MTLFIALNAFHSVLVAINSESSSFEKRRTAIKIMQLLSDYNPLLIGSVWRGTAHKRSDIDIVVYGLNHEEIISKLKFSGYEIEKTEKVVVTKKGKANISNHIISKSEKGFKVEIVIRHPNEIDEKVKCEIYGDVKKGLSLQELKMLIEKDPLKKFVPGRRY